MILSTFLKLCSSCECMEQDYSSPFSNSGTLDQSLLQYETHYNSLIKNHGNTLL